MGKCLKCSKECELCYLCRGQYPHQRCVDDDICHECFMVENPKGRIGVTKLTMKRNFNGGEAKTPQRVRSLLGNNRVPVK